jgi:hypothetical protein
VHSLLAEDGSYAFFDSDDDDDEDCDESDLDSDDETYDDEDDRVSAYLCTLPL